MRKFIFLSLPIAIVIGISIYMRMYVPALPVRSVSKYEVLNQVQPTSRGMVKITEENGYQWYICEMDEGKAYDYLKKWMKNRGWTFKEQIGSGFLFQREQGEIIIHSEMWTQNYVLFHFPSGI